MTSDYTPPADPLPWLTARFRSQGCTEPSTWATDAQKGAGLLAWRESLNSAVAGLNARDKRFTVRWSPSASTAATGEASAQVIIGLKPLMDPDLTFGQRVAVLMGEAYHESGHVAYTGKWGDLLAATYPDPRQPTGINALAMDASNVAADIMLEARRREDAPGYAPTLEPTLWWVGDKGKRQPVGPNGEPDMTSPIRRFNVGADVVRYPWLYDWDATPRMREWADWWLEWGEWAAKARCFAAHELVVNAAMNKSREPWPQDEPEPEPDEQDEPEDEPEGDPGEDEDTPKPDEGDGGGLGESDEAEDEPDPDATEGSDGDDGEATDSEDGEPTEGDGESEGTPMDDPLPDQSKDYGEDGEDGDDAEPDESEGDDAEDGPPGEPMGEAETGDGEGTEDGDDESDADSDDEGESATGDDAPDSEAKPDSDDENPSADRDGSGEDTDEEPEPVDDGEPDPDRPPLEVSEATKDKSWNQHEADYLSDAEAQRIQAQASKRERTYTVRGQEYRVVLRRKGA